MLSTSTKSDNVIQLQIKQDLSSLSSIPTPTNITHLKYISKGNHSIQFHRRCYSAFECNYYHEDSISKIDLPPRVQYLPKNKSSIHLTPKNKEKAKIYKSYTNTETSIDFVNSVKQFFHSNQSFNLIPFTPIQYLDYENIKQTYFIRNTSSTLQKLFNDENITYLHIDINNKSNHTWFFCGLHSGQIKIFSIEQDAIIANFNSEKGLKNVPITSIAYDSYSFKVVAGFKNGNIVVYDIKKITRPKIIVNFTLSNETPITHLCPFSIGNNNEDKSFGFFALDSKGKVFRVYLTKNKLSFLINDTVILFQNTINAFYNISLYKLNPNVFAIGDCTMIKVVKYSELKVTNTNIIHKVKSLLEIPLTENEIQSTLPSFTFLGNSSSINYPMFCIAINNSILTYAIHQFDLTLTLERSFSFNNTIIDIGSFSFNSLYIVDSLFKVFHIDVLNNKTHFSGLDLNDLNILPNKQIICISNSEGGKVIPVYFNMFHSLDNKSYFYIRTERNITCIKPMDIKDYINDLQHTRTLSSEEKWKRIFSFLIAIKTNNHAVYQFHNVNSELGDIVKKLSEGFLRNCFISSHGTTKTIYIDILLPMMINTLFEMQLIQYITTDLKKFFEEIEENQKYFSLIEPFILRDKLISKLVPSDFILDLIDYYSQNNNRQKLQHVIMHFNNVLLSTDNDIYSKLSATKNYFILFEISLKGQTINYYDPIEYIVRELNYVEIKNDDKSIIHSCYDMNLEEIVYKDKIFFTCHYMKLEMLWYIIQIIDSKGVEIINNDKEKIIELFSSKKMFDMFCLISFLPKEFFYVIKYIIKKCEENKVRKKLIERNYEKCMMILKESYNKNESIQTILKEFYLVGLYTFVNFPLIDVRNELKIKTITFLMEYNYTNKDNISEIENMIIKVIQDIDYLTNDDSIILIGTGRKSIFTKVKDFISDNINV